VALFDTEDGWPDLQQAASLLRRRIAGSAVHVRFEGLPPGTYAVFAFHDENENGELDMRWLPYPRPVEWGGSSNNPEPGLGPPDFDEVSVHLGEAPLSLPIRLQPL